ncbi:MAG: hypothetical protein R3B09_29160 [Nannocystaceae bacterium]
MPGIRSLIPALALVLCVCDKPASGSHPPIAGASDAGGKPIQGGGGVAPGDAGGGGTPGSAGGGSSASGTAASNTVAAPPPCQPALDAEPTGLFGMRLLIKLPAGVELIEENPFYARSVGGNQASSCGTQIHFSALGYLRSAAPLVDVRKYVLRLRGLSGESPSFSGETNLGSTLSSIYEVPQSESGAPPLRGWMVLRRDGAWVYWTLFEAHPSNFAALEGVFKAATQSIMIRSVKDG